MVKTLCTENNTSNIRWVKQCDITSLVFIKPNVVAFGRGSTITFVNVDDGTEQYYHCLEECASTDTSKTRTANGISCLAAHPTHGIFAFAELSFSARLVLVTYPGFRHVTTLESEKTGGYISLDFSETEHLIALTSLPQYSIDVWNWRTDRLLAVQHSEMIADDKYIRCSHSLPLTMLQLSRSQSKIDLWEVYLSLETASLIRRAVKLPIDKSEHDFDATIGIDGTLYFIDGDSTVWSINATSGKETRIISFDTDEPHSAHTAIKYFNGGLVIVAGKNLRMFRKASGKWSECWSKTHTCDIKSLTCSEDQLFIVSSNGEIMRLMDNEKLVPALSMVTAMKRLFKFIGLVNPVGNYFVAVTEANEIVIYNVKDGTEESSLTLAGIQCMASHESLPVIAVGTRNGTVSILSVVDPKSATLLHKFYLCRNTIDKIEFISGGHHVVVNSGSDFFLMEGEFGKSLQVTSRVELDERALDFAFITQIDQLKSLVVLTTAVDSSEYHSDSLLEIAIDESPMRRINGSLPHSYTRIVSNMAIARHMFIGARYNSKSVDLIEIRRGEEELTFLKARTIETGHHLNYLDLMVDTYFLITWSLEGLVFVWDLNSLELLNKHQSQNRYTYGVKAAICTPTAEHFISLGQSGNIVCAHFDDSKHLSRELVNLRDAIDYDLASGSGGDLDDELQDKPWIDIQAERQRELIRQQYAKEKEEILQEFHEIKAKLKICIDANEAEPIEEQLPINSFNLDLYGAQSLIEIARNHRELEHQRLKDQCHEQNELIDWIKKNTWDLMEVKSTKLRGIFSKLCVENYALKFTDDEFEENIKRIQFRRSRELMASSNDIFNPWLPRNVDQLEQQLSRRPCIVKDGDVALGRNVSFAARIRSHFTFRNQKSVSEDLPEAGVNYALSGTSTHLYVRPLDIRYAQMEVVSYNQMYAEHQMGLYDLLQLRKYFNKKFDALMNDKKTEMNLVKEGNKRLLYIQNELNDLKRLDGYANYGEHDNNDPEFAADEMPETIVQVDDSEVCVMPYVSPSQQNILNQLADEAERRRQEMLRDDFRERALMAMMDGVLEVRWEDEIKKNPTKPKCLLADDIDPSDYTEQDIEEVQFYEARLKHVKEERLKYYEMLVEEKTQVHQLLENQILGFNRRIGQLLLSKIRVEFAMCSEDMKMLLYSKFNFERDQFREREEKLLKEKRDIKNDIDELMKTLAMVEGNFYTCKTKYDELVLKDRMLDKQFKSSFSEYAAQAVVDQAYRIFRRRPRLQPRAWQTAAVLADMAKRVSVADTTMTGPPLPDECFQYLNTIDHIEKFSNAPNLLDQNLWQILCRMRRNKIEVELKLRSCGEQLEEAEATINTYSREISYRKSKLTQCDKKLEDLKEQKAKHLINRNIQIYTKRGNVEIPLNGRMSDFENAILLHKTNLNETNASIQEAGKIKLRVMQKAAAFRRHVQCQEWKHKELKMKIDALKNFIKFIDKCKVTKEVQIWLKRKQLGRTEDLSDSAIERDISARVASYERVNNDLTNKLNRLNAQVENEMRQNDILDRKIQNLNLNIQEQSMTKDPLFGEKEQERRNERMAVILERARLVRKVQQQHGQILEHSTLLELQRLRTYPTLNLSLKSPEKLNDS